MAVGLTELLRHRDSAVGQGRDSSLSERVRAHEVHKKKPENVWLFDAVEESPHSICAWFEVPCRDDLVRFVDLIEVQRQIGILQAHRQLGVPEDEVFVLDQIGLRLVTRAPEVDAPRGQGIVRTQIVAASTRGRARSLSQHFALEAPSGLVAIGTAQASLIPSAVYDRVRRQAADSKSSGRHKNAALGYEGVLRVDRDDPVLADHPSDHLTAMQTIAEVEKVALTEFPASGVRSLKLTFSKYAEMQPAPMLRLDVSSKGRFAAEVTQRGARCAKITGVLDMEAERK